MIGLDDFAIKGDCKSSLNANVESVMISAQKSGKFKNNVNIIIHIMFYNTTLAFSVFWLAETRSRGMSFIV